MAAASEYHSRVAGWVERVALALVIVLASHAVPYYVLNELSWHLPDHWLTWVSQHHGWSYYQDLLALAFGLLLALPTPRRSGLALGTLRGCWWKVLLVCAVPLVLTAVVYPRLETRPFAGATRSMWLISPLAQDLVFGYLYGRFAEVGGGRITPRLPVTWALVATALAFAAWHLPNFASAPTGYVLFQLAYTFIGMLWVGMTRVRTGSILYTVAVHMGVNYIAWKMS